LFIDHTEMFIAHLVFFSIFFLNSLSRRNPQGWSPSRRFRVPPPRLRVCSQDALVSLPSLSGQITLEFFDVTQGALLPGTPLATCPAWLATPERP
ncbi:MAG: hypothetical protein ACE5JS_01655, partial [Nitrospinota bacterium]